jgi:phosphoribosylformylglycinamidine cyclo-ligase
MSSSSPIRYADAGVNIDEGDRAVDTIKQHAAATMSKRVLTGIGSFGAGYELKGYEKPVLVSSADGVGTKLKVAHLAGIHDTIGHDLVNHCVNDIMVQGADPLFFLDYFAMGTLDAMVAGQVVSGVAKGCVENGVALIGGETAEMPGLYAPGDYDLAGFIVGVVEKDELVTGKKIKPGDALLAFPSNGLHTNGYSLARKLFFEVAGYTVATVPDGLGIPLGEELLKVHRSYQKPLRALRKAGVLKGAAHITGGGITGNTPRMLPDALGAEIELDSWMVPPVFELLRRIGGVPEDDWLRTFNVGVGMIVAVSAKKLKAAVSALDAVEAEHWQIGTVVEAGQGPRVVYR